MGRRQAARAAAQRRRSEAAVIIQKNVRSRLARKKVGLHLYLSACLNLLLLFGCSLKPHLISNYRCSFYGSRLWQVIAMMLFDGLYNHRKAPLKICEDLRFPCCES